MPVLAQGAPIRSRNPTLLVENRLEAGSWRFQLTVVNDSGIESDPAELVVRVVRVAQPPRPTGPVILPGDATIPPAAPSPPRPTTPVSPVRPGRRVRPVRPPR